MKSSKKHLFSNNKFILFMLLVLIAIVGVTFAYYKTEDYIDNLFTTSTYGTKAVEEFTSPSNWKPGDTTPKTLTIKNTGSFCENVRVSYTEKWVSKNGKILSNKQNDENLTQLNLANGTDWVKNGDYYYYNKNLNSGQTTSTILESVTYNKNVAGDYVCSESGNTSKCTASSNPYDGAIYHLTFNIETIECSASEESWNLKVTDLHGPAKFDIGRRVNTKLKTLANDGTTVGYNTEDTSIVKFIRASSLPNDFVPSEANTISASDSVYPIYAFSTDEYIMPQAIRQTTIFWYCESNDVYLNEDSSRFFLKMSKLTDISGIQYANASKVENFTNFLGYCLTITDISPLADFDTRSLTDIHGMFFVCSSLSNLTPLQNWDMSHVTVIQTAFDSTAITSLAGLESWDVSNVETMEQTFNKCSNLTNITALANWNTSKVKNFHCTFQLCSSLVNISSLAGWDTSSAITMQGMFLKANLNNLNALSSWNVSNVTNMQFMFEDNTNLQSASGINNWDIRSVTYNENNNGFFTIFNRCNGVHPTFTKRNGTWNTTTGTFIPSN